MLSPAVAHLVVDLALLYAAIGVGVGIAFLAFGIERLDPASRAAYAFRALLLPGLALLWPLVLLRWLPALKEPPR